MSISSLADDEILRTERRNLILTPAIDRHLGSIIPTLGLTPAAEQQLRAAVQPLAAETPVQKTPPSNALDSLVKYIPTESITLYVAATSAATLSTLKTSFPNFSMWWVYWSFVVLTPILFLLVYVGKRRSQKLSFLPNEISQWPWWKLFASTVAFMVWALAVPPLLESSDVGKVAAAFGALIVSTMLSLFGAVFEPPES
jgi:hypothetical protein